MEETSKTIHNCILLYGITCSLQFHDQVLTWSIYPISFFCQITTRWTLSSPLLFWCDVENDKMFNQNSKQNKMQPNFIKLGFIIIKSLRNVLGECLIFTNKIWSMIPFKDCVSNYFGFNLICLLDKKSFVFEIIFETIKEISLIGSH